MLRLRRRMFGHSDSPRRGAHPVGPVDNPDGATSIARTCGPSGADAGQIRGSRNITKRENQTITIQRYSVNQHPIQTLLTWIESDEIAIPEIQRPFVWNAAKVRDFIDSLYFGYPVGYLIALAQSIGPVEGRNQIGGQANSDRRPATRDRPSGSHVGAVDCRQALPEGAYHDCVPSPARNGSR